MQVYIKSNFVYGFDRLRTFRAEDLAGNYKSSLKYIRHDDKNMDQGSLLLLGSK